MSLKVVILNTAVSLHLLTACGTVFLANLIPNLRKKSAAFDVGKGESLLVPDFNVEYGGADVALARLFA